VEPKVNPQTLGNITSLALAVAREELLQIVLGIYPPRRITMPPLKATDSLVVVVLVELAALPLTITLSMVVEAEVVADMEMALQA
tara:strand:+ start:1325 stop:1579 length:255 start_codon:yes stop_codon:yes gene_type:complete